MTPRSRGVLFDFGGTLNTNGDHIGAMFRRELGTLFPDADVHALEDAYIRSERELVREGLSKETFRDTLRMQVLKQFHALDAGDRQKDGLYLAERVYREVADRMEEVRRLLADLSGRYRLGVVSNFYGNLEAVCDEFEIGGYFDVLLDSALVGVRKPDPELWRIAVDALGLPAEEVFVVGDSYKNDILPGKEIGCRTIWYRGLEWRPGSDGSAADVEVRSLEELRRVLLG